MQSAADDTKSALYRPAEPGPTDMPVRGGLAPHGAPGGLHVDFVTEYSVLKR